MPRRFVFVNNYLLCPLPPTYRLRPSRCARSYTPGVACCGGDVRLRWLMERGGEATERWAKCRRRSDASVWRDYAGDHRTPVRPTAQHVAVFMAGVCVLSLHVPTGLVRMGSPFGPRSIPPAPCGRGAYMHAACHCPGMPLAGATRVPATWHRVCKCNAHARYRGMGAATPLQDACQRPGTGVADANGRPASHYGRHVAVHGACHQ